MATVQLILLFVQLLFVVNSQQCEVIRVERGDVFGTLGTCCAVWDHYPDRMVISRRGLLTGLLGGVGIGVGINGYASNSRGESVSGGIGAGIGAGAGIGVGAGGPAYETPAPSPVAAGVNIAPAYLPVAAPRVAY